MSMGTIIQWLLLIITAALLIFLKWLHIGVTHYNIFLLILIGWTLVLVTAFRGLAADQRQEE